MLMEQSATFLTAKRISFLSILTDERHFKQVTKLLQSYL